MRLNRNKLRNMILREMRSMNEQGTTPTVTITVNVSDGGFNIDGPGGDNDYANLPNSMSELIEELYENPAYKNVMIDVFPNLVGVNLQRRMYNVDEAVDRIQQIGKQLNKMFR